MGQASRQNREQQKIRELEAELKLLRKQLGEKDEVIEILKKIRRHPVETIEEKYRCTQALSRQGLSVERVCRTLEISRSGYYDFCRRDPTKRELHNQVLRRRLVELHEKYPALGLDSLYHLLKSEIPCSRKRVHRQMCLLGIHSARRRAYKITTNSNHSNSIAPNLLQRKFYFDHLNQA
ncbi:hypothetical protein D7X33_04975 [Butyricicoccus sp. 1XD8-22]|nr:hypothetical protein D7X33_04975 [Butyricicoccus sp. 1XD8-22]